MFSKLSSAAFLKTPLLRHGVKAFVVWAFSLPTWVPPSFGGAFFPSNHCSRVVVVLFFLFSQWMTWPEREALEKC